MGCEQLAQGCCAAALLPGFEPMTFQLRLPGYSNYTYNERLALLNLPSLELRRLRLDLIWCYKILFGLITLGPNLVQETKVFLCWLTYRHGVYKLQVSKLH